MKKHLTKFQKIVLSIVIFTLCTGFDRVTKNIARARLIDLPPITLLNGLVKLQYTENTGAMLSLGAGLNAELRYIIFVVLIGVVLAAAYVILILTDEINRAQLVGMFILVSGGAGNLIDRLIHHNHAVIDFISIHIRTVQTGIFNLADVFVFGGVGLVLIATLTESDQQENPDDQSP
jgi:signal peptidase II